MTDPSPPSQYKDEDLVYVDVQNRVVVGLVQWDKNGNPRPLAMPSRSDDNDSEEEKPKAKTAGGKLRRASFSPRIRYYPWGTYRSMKIIYQLEGKRRKEEPSGTLDEVMEKALKEPYWD